MPFLWFTVMANAADMVVFLALSAPKTIGVEFSFVLVVLCGFNCLISRNNAKNSELELKDKTGGFVLE